MKITIALPKKTLRTSHNVLGLHVLHALLAITVLISRNWKPMQHSLIWLLFSLHWPLGFSLLSFYSWSGLPFPAWGFPTRGPNLRLPYLLHCSVQFSRSVVSDSLQPHGLQHIRLPCPSPTPGVYSNSCPLSQWCHPTIFFSVVPFSSCLQSFPASGSFHFFASGGQSIGVSTSASILTMNIQDWFPLGLTGLISLQSLGGTSPTPQFKSINSLAFSFRYGPTLKCIRDYWKNQNFD